jgi:uncharacterized protein (DUF927 family)
MDLTPESIEAYLPDPPDMDDLLDQIVEDDRFAEDQADEGAPDPDPEDDQTPGFDDEPTAQVEDRSEAPRRREFEVRKDGVYHVNEDGDAKWISSPLHVEALTRDDDGCNWGRLLTHVDPDQRRHTYTIPMELFAGDFSAVCARLLNLGVKISSNRKQRDLLAQYIQHAKPEVRALCTTKVGWRDQGFVLPDETLGRLGTERVVFQDGACEHALRTAGTLEEWRERVGRLCIGNSRLSFSVSCAFAAPLLRMLGQESGGFHLRGGSSTGKTTSLWVAGSVCGGGPSGYIRTWRTTSNGLEAVAEMHNDLLLLLDELGQIDAKDAGAVAYMLANGQGKVRMNQALGMQRTPTWTTLFLSTGEISLDDQVLAAGGTVHGGQEVRVVEINADAGKGMGLFECIHDHADPARLAKALVDAARRYYGVPIRTFLSHVAKNYEVAGNQIRDMKDNFTTKFRPTRAVSEVDRVLGRFALIAAAGELATQLGITGWPEGEATNASVQCFESWLSIRGTATGTSDGERWCPHGSGVHRGARDDQVPGSQNAGPLSAGRRQF